MDEEKLSAFLVALDHRDYVGVVGLELFDENALLRSLAVSAEQRGNGLGSGLLHAVETEAVRRGVTSLFLLTTTATSFFERAGYKACDRQTVPPAIAATREFSDICPDSADCLWRSL